MLFRSGSREKRNHKPFIVEQNETATDRDDSGHKAEHRRLLYERIAQGNALSEVEENAQRRWQ